MLLAWLDSRQATEVGNALADELVLQTASGTSGNPRNGSPEPRHRDLQTFLRRFHQRIDDEARPLQLNLFQRAKLVNSFKWRLREKGVQNELVDELTQALVLRLSGAAPSSSPVGGPLSSARRLRAGSMQALLAQGIEHHSRGAYADAVRCYEELLGSSPRHAVARHNLGAVLCQLGRYKEAQEQFRRAIGVKANYAEAHCALGTLLRWQGRVIESEPPLRRALKLKPTYLDAQLSLSATLVLLGRLGEAKAMLERALKTAPGNVGALVGLGEIGGLEGRLAEAEALFKRAADIDPSAPGPWAAMVWARRMTPADSAWVKHAETIATTALAPLEEANIRYAIGKYCDDVGDFKLAFRNYRRANELRKLAAEPYARDVRTRFVDDMQRVYTAEVLAQARAGASDSRRPVFVVGMPRSGTTLVAQILASHSEVKSAGELPFWGDAMRRHERTLRQEPPGEALARKLSEQYLRVLAERWAHPTHVVDKATFNSEYLGVIRAVFPNARVIYLRRNPIDTCLSCYFHQLSPELSFTMDLSDLAHYYREHQRLLAHWRSALPPGTMLDVPYEGLVDDQEGWTRKILEFIGLGWDARCLEFHRTERTITTASYWQVRQKIYRTSVNRWRNYREFIKPLLSLTDAA
jgi:tetratricopeptide (TPR) repeat protein